MFKYKIYLWSIMSAAKSAHTMITVSDIVSRETPAKKDAAPMRAIAPGSIHIQNGSVGIPP